MERQVVSKPVIFFLRGRRFCAFVGSMTFKDGTELREWCIDHLVVQIIVFIRENERYEDAEKERNGKFLQDVYSFIISNTVWDHE